MFKTFFTLIFTAFLLLPNLAIADNEQNASTEVEEKEAAPQEEIKEEISEAQKEADAAEAAELREAGVETEELTQ